MHSCLSYWSWKSPQNMAQLLSFRLKVPAPWLVIFLISFVIFFLKNIFHKWEMCLVPGSSAVLGDMERHCCLAQSKLLGPYLWLRSDSQESWGWGSYSQLLPTLETGQPSPSILLLLLLKRLIWGMLCLPCSVMPQGLGFHPLFICLIVAMEIQYLKR